MNQRPRLADVAKLAGVSKSTVSSVINGRVDEANRVSPETQRRVLDAVQQLGFVADPLARRLAGGSNRLLGIFTFEPIFPVRFRDFFYPFLVGIENEAEQEGFNLVLFTSTPLVNGRRAIYQEGVNSLRLADGAILLGLHDDKTEIMRLMRENYPFVYIGHREVAEGRVPFVTYDSTGATREVMQHLFDLGHREIAYLRLPGDNEPSSDRQRGYVDAFQQTGRSLNPDWIVRSQPELLDGRQVAELLDAGITAVVAETDGIAARVLDIARDMGCSVPDDLSIALLGDPLEAAVAEDWTMFSIPREQIGQEAVRLLARRMNSSQDDDAVQQIFLPCRLVIGRTTGRPRASIGPEK